MNSIQFGHHVFLNVLSILKRLSFEGSFHLRKEKNLITINGIILTSLDEVFHDVSLRCFCESVWDGLCAKPSSSINLHGGFDELSSY